MNQHKFDNHDFIRYCSQLEKLGRNKVTFSVKSGIELCSYDLMQFFFKVLERTKSGFFYNKNVIACNMEKIFFLLYNLNIDYDNVLVNLLDPEEYQDLIFNENINLFGKKYILLGWALITECDKYAKIDMFEIFLKNHNFGALLYDKIEEYFYKINKSVYISDPITNSINYWLYKIKVIDRMYDDFNEDDEIKNFLVNEMNWDESAIDNYFKNKDNSDEDDLSSKIIISSPPTPHALLQQDIKLPPLPAKITLETPNLISPSLPQDMKCSLSPTEQPKLIVPQLPSPPPINPKLVGSQLLPN